MPFTLSHPAVVLGLRRSGLPLAAMVAGSMVPDLPMFGIVPYSYGRSHTVRGLVTVDLAAGMTAFAVWGLLVRGLVVSACPARLRDRLPPADALTRRVWLLAPVAVVVGALTHVAWDAFTHEDRWGYAHIAWLREDHAGHAGFHWTQAASSALGLLVVAGYAARRLTRRATHTTPASAPTVARWSLAAVLATTASAAVIVALPDLDAGLHDAAFSGAVTALAVLPIGLVAAGVLWRYAAGRSA